MGSLEGAADSRPSLSYGPDLQRINLELSEVLGYLLEEVTRPELSWFPKFFNISPNIEKLTQQPIKMVLLSLLCPLPIILEVTYSFGKNPLPLHQRGPRASQVILILRND